MPKKILISNVLPRESLALIPRDIEVDFNDSDQPLPKAELIRRLREKDGLICQIVSTIDVLGFGRIGRAVARRAQGFNMRVLYQDAVRADAGVERELRATSTDKETVLRESDFVSVHTPLLPETRHYVDERALKMMKPSAILINAARGPIVDEAALVRALTEGWIAGAGLDVFENEPAIHPGLLGLKNVVLAPHLGSASRD